MTPDYTDAATIARHEGGHVAMALTVGIPVVHIAVDSGNGWVHYGDHSTAAHERLMAALAGPLEVCDYADVDRLLNWPIEPDDHPGEERYDWAVIRRMADLAQLTHRDYKRVVVAALELSARNSYQRYVAATSGVLDYTPVLDRQAIAHMRVIAERRHDDG